MFSINQNRKDKNNRTEEIYIPLCFLLTSDLPARRHGGKHIYIPLCFLLTRLCVPRPRDWQRYLHSTMFSINPSRIIRNCSNIAYLHSTMFSINRRSCRNLFSGKVIYIPLCFLLISAPRNDSGIIKIFTFHYVFY